MALASRKNPRKGADAQLLAGIRESVSALPNSSRVDFQIRSVKEAASTVHRAAQSSQELVGTNSDAPAAPLVRDALIARGLKAAALKDAEKEFAVSALSHAQAALQHAVHQPVEERPLRPARRYCIVS